MDRRLLRKQRVGISDPPAFTICRLLGKPLHAVRLYHVFFLLPALVAGQQTPPSNAVRSPVTPQDRWDWFASNTVSPLYLFAQTFTAGYGTLFDDPKEYGTHWAGFGKRYGIDMTNAATSNLMEIGLGALWGEDPAYHPVPERTFVHRLGHILKFTLVTENRQMRTVPAYARYTAYVGSSFLSNAWRADSEANISAAAVRVGHGLLGRLGSNIFIEFWPDAKRKLRVARRRAPLDGGHQSTQPLQGAGD